MTKRNLLPVSEADTVWLMKNYPEPMNALIANFNSVTGASIAPVHAGEMVDFSVLRVLMGMVEAITKVLEQAELPPATATDPGYWQEGKQ